MPKQFFLMNSRDSIQHIAGRIIRFHTFPEKNVQTWKLPLNATEEPPLTQMPWNKKKDIKWISKHTPKRTGRIPTKSKDKIRDSVEYKQSRIAWQTINGVSRRDSTAKAQLKATNQQERIKLWKQHFQNLLESHPKVTHEPTIRIIRKQLNIKIGSFTLEKLDSVL